MFRTGPFKVSDIPVEFRSAIDHSAALNPGYRQVYFDDSDVERFIIDHFPEHLDRYHSLIPGAFKADLFRLLLLYKYGGIYNDLSHGYMKSVGEIKNGYDTVLVKDSEAWGDAVYNAFMIAPKGSAIVRAFIDHIAANIDAQEYGESMIDITGPRALGRVYFDGTERPEVKMLYLIFENYEINDGDTPVIKVKIVDYENTKKLLYGDTKHYSELWDERKVFQTRT